MSWTFLDTWIVVTAVLTGLACALLGNFLVLRRMSMMGDAISHAVLPGLAIAFLISGSRGSWVMLVGAAVVGVLTAVFTQWISHFGRVEESASMGVVFTGLFALGLILIVRAADAVDLDPGCVLYGAIELTPLDTIPIAGFDVPRAALMIGGVLLADALFVMLFFKELKISSFDPSLSTTLGFNARLMHYLLMVFVAVTTVAAFESVGSILVIAMLIVPPAVAHLLTDRLHTMVLVSLVVAALCASFGHVAAITVPRWWGFADTSTSGSIAVVLGLVFLLALLAAPRYGIVSRAVHQFLLRVRMAREDVLGLVYRGEETGWPAETLARHLRGIGTVERGLAVRMLRRDAALEDGEQLRLTPAGREQARNLIRSHRLWESFLHQQAGLAPDHVHATSELLEHVTTAEMQKELAEGVADARRDPHGHRIPGDARDD
jgi:manganese/zinc/iron transport system permease protein